MKMQIKVFAKSLKLHILPFEHCVKDKISLLPKVNNISVARSRHYSPHCILIYMYNRPSSIDLYHVPWMIRFIFLSSFRH